MTRELFFSSRYKALESLCDELMLFLARRQNEHYGYFLDINRALAS